MRDAKEKLIKELEEDKEALIGEVQRLKKPRFTELKDKDLENTYMGWLRQDLWDSTERLKALLAEKTALSTKISSVETQINRIESSTAIAVASEVDNEGKKRFTNETVRKAEVDQRLLRHKEYSVLQDEIRELKHKQAENNNNVEILKMEVRNKRHILDSMPREVRQV